LKTISSASFIEIEDNFPDEKNFETPLSQPSSERDKCTSRVIIPHPNQSQQHQQKLQSASKTGNSRKKLGSKKDVSEVEDNSLFDTRNSLSPPPSPLSSFCDSSSVISHLNETTQSQSQTQNLSQNCSQHQSQNYSQNYSQTYSQDYSQEYTQSQSQDLNQNENGDENESDVEKDEEFKNLNTNENEKSNKRSLKNNIKKNTQTKKKETDFEDQSQESITTSKSKQTKGKRNPPAIDLTSRTRGERGENENGSDKYKRYRMKQKAKLESMHDDLEKTTLEVERLKAREKKLLYLLLASNKQLMIKDQECAKVKLELEKAKSKNVDLDQRELFQLHHQILQTLRSLKDLSSSSSTSQTQTLNLPSNSNSNSNALNNQLNLNPNITPVLNSNSDTISTINSLTTMQSNLSRSTSLIMNSMKHQLHSHFIQNQDQNQNQSQERFVENSLKMYDSEVRSELEENVLSSILDEEYIYDRYKQKSFHSSPQNSNQGKQQQKQHNQTESFLNQNSNSNSNSNQNSKIRNITTSTSFTIHSQEQESQFVPNQSLQTISISLNNQSRTFGSQKSFSFTSERGKKSFIRVSSLEQILSMDDLDGKKFKAGFYSELFKNI